MLHFLVIEIMMKINMQKYYYQNKFKPDFILHFY